MNLALIIFAVVSLIELGIVFSKTSINIRKFVGAVLVLLLTASQTALVVIDPSIPLMIFWLVGVFRVVNLMRLAASRMVEAYLFKVVRRSSVRLMILQAAAFGISLGLVKLEHTGLILALGLALLANLTILLTALKNTRRNILPTGQKIAAAKLPTVSVAIPARNETEDLTFCIESILKSDYPKLEILVLDDCSQDKTPELIKSFAHRGVRFVDGEEPSTSWLAKNAAYQKLADEAIGDYILFCGIDVRFEHDTVSRLLNAMLNKKLDMIGLLPERGESKPNSLLLQAARYWWELSLPRRILNRPPALSTAWLVNKKALSKAGGFKAVRRSIMPERYFAWTFAKSNSYLFAGNTKQPLIYSVKSIADQWDTAIRLRYPQLRKRPENVAGYLLSIGLIGIMPLVIVILNIWSKSDQLEILLALSSIGAVLLTNSLIYAMTAPKWAWLGLITAYPVLAVDLASLLISMWRYEFTSVEWKGRNVCLPVMHVIPELPKS